MRKRHSAVLTLKALLLLAVFVMLWLLWLPFPRRSAQTRPDTIDFNRDIRPLLADKCFACHGPDAPKSIKLRLDSETAALAELSRGRRAIAPGQPEQSELVKRITASDEAMRMPPADSGRTLAKREIELLTEWIRQGARWQTHWSFIPPRRPALPEIKNKAWARNAIDHFVLARLEKEGLAPQAEADRATLLRRAALDLTGLPPAPREVDAFLNDKATNAYEKALDRLLSSPRYGERMAFKWLEATRYADTNGYQLDGERMMWRWRDWVIEAFNENKPFDQFIVEQLAGDLLPSPTLAQHIATGFNRNHRINSEDGVVPEEYAVEYVVDRVDTTSTLFLGLTMGCARCHNHKYDPLTQREYYQLYSYFNSVPEDGRASNYGNSAPWLPAPTPEQQAQLAKLENEISATEKRFALLANRAQPVQRQWEKSLNAGNVRQHWFPGEKLALHHTLDENAHADINEAAAEGNKPQDSNAVSSAQTANNKAPAASFKEGAPTHCAAPAGQGVTFDGKLYFDAGKIADFNYRDRFRDFRDKFTVALWFYPEAEQSGALVTKMSDNVEAKENNVPKTRGYGLLFINGKVHFNLVGVWADDSLRVETAEELPVKQWHHLIATFDSSQPYEKIQIFVNGRKQQLKVNNGRLFRGFADSNANLRIGAGGGREYRFKGMMDEVRLYKGLPSAEDIAILACADSLANIAALPLPQRSKGQRLKLRNAFLEHAAPAVLRQTWRRLRELQQQKVDLADSFPTVMVMQETPQPRQAFVLKRGAYDAPGEKVARGVPAVLPPLPQGAPNNRLGFAKWLVQPSQPLTARVTVNRFWQMLFGAGLVKTVEDFGAQGELPSHPELLDWLATTFRHGTGSGSDLAGPGNRIGQSHPLATARGTEPKGWDVKALLKTIMLSATYRQSSAATPGLLQRDPDNRLFARGARLRLPAEMIRDQALLISGLLVERLGGASVKPYQPAGLWNDMVFKEIKYEQDHGAQLYRRSLYTYWKRTIAPPELATFDAALRESCTVRETRTNTPLQALNLMNDVTYVEAARMLAERMLRAGGQGADERLRFAFRLATARAPQAAELQILRDNLQAQLAYFSKHPAGAAKLLGVGERRADEKLKVAELAAYAAVASLILNLDEAITKE